MKQITNMIIVVAKGVITAVTMAVMAVMLFALWIPYILCFLCAGGNSEQQCVQDMEGLAEVDAHSYAMANSIHYDLSELIEGPIIMKPHSYK